MKDNYFKVKKGLIVYGDNGLLFNAGSNNIIKIGGEGNETIISDGLNLRLNQITEEENNTRLLSIDTNNKVSFTNIGESGSNLGFLRINDSNTKDSILILGSNEYAETYNDFTYKNGMMGVGVEDPTSIVDIKGVDQNLLSVKNEDNNGVEVDLDGLLLIKERSSFNFDTVKPKGTLVLFNGDLFLKT